MNKQYDVIIIGSGASGFACAERLFSSGITNICIFSDNVLSGTSRNAGSDKQTYYKLDISSEQGDSIAKMAQDLYNGGSMNGTDAYLEASNSLRCFMHLVELGVPFPHDSYGAFQGYRTDHDNTCRATSAGPLTSRFMTEKLENKVKSNGTEIFSGYTAVKLIVSDNKCCGVYFIHNKKITAVYSKAVILCTGAPAAIYADSVYPIGHKGCTGIAIDAGAELQNFQEWQYGIASKKFRWNLSGSYQQVIPRYYSVDSDGTEYDFLSNLDNRYDLIFLKGYEWPFDSNKTDSSSKIDILVSKEISAGRQVYIDYTKNPDGFAYSKLNKTSIEYWEKAGVNASTPIQRLLQLNPKAYDLYLSHGIDLKYEPLEIGICSQHNNGGIRVDSNGETNIRGLFCAGEASGRFGVYRPGGAALNDTQVGALLISNYLRHNIGDYSIDDSHCNSPELPDISKISNVKSTDEYFARRMSDFSGNVRNVEKTRETVKELDYLLKNFAASVSINSEDEYSSYFELYNTTLSRYALCNTICDCSDKCGSRGGCLYIKDNTIIPENKQYRSKITITKNNSVEYYQVNDIPTEKINFEKLLKEFGR